MLRLLRPKNEKDLGEKLFGKVKKFRLARNGSAVTVTGRLLAVFRREVEPDGLMPPRAGRVELLAVFQTRAGRFLVYYVVSYPETEDIAGRQEYVTVCPGLDAVREFLAAMHYPNRARFADAVLAQAALTLSGKPKAAPPAPETAAAADGPAGLDHAPVSEKKEAAKTPAAETQPAPAGSVQKSDC
ncbi:hypothetical protein DFW101_3092 [Solidesulfovibrio carbinoliphilus subsp. oakridgensis]|uniref:Uncharacterized protein n=1 Tax=Solidesulfovibrio carbinoliphilus subsp. oakridgensis TaxID=694327 RepID=G7Q8K5_9BACT|nr:hypothetical protein [Solidesulfovibrio carbinoliphilus]EHJ49092.1 hypothetical protein DFW101_3092 [Solidesulfovibrio carbinoliphilus subsp. oakridgensis]